MKKQFIIGITGGSAGGKSTFAKNLAQRLGENVQVIGMDNYFMPSRNVAPSPVTGKLYRDDNSPESFNLRQLKKDLESSTAEIVIIEGLFTFYDEEIYGKLDLKLYVDCPDDVRITRRLKRNMEWGLTFDEISEVYLGLVKFRHKQYVEPMEWKAELVINGVQPTEVCYSVIEQYVKSR